LNFFGCGDKEHLTAPPNFLSIGFAHEELWGKMPFLMNEVVWQGYLQ